MSSKVKILVECQATDGSWLYVARFRSAEKADAEVARIRLDGTLKVRARLVTRAEFYAAEPAPTVASARAPGVVVAPLAPPADPPAHPDHVARWDGHVDTIVVGELEAEVFERAPSEVGRSGDTHGVRINRTYRGKFYGTTHPVISHHASLAAAKAAAAERLEELRDWHPADPSGS